MADSYLKVSIASKKFDNKEVLMNVNFDLKRGEVLCLMGASGSGKTTLARCIAGFERFDGQIFLNSKDITHLHPRKRQVGIVTQDGALFPHLNVEGNIGFGIKDKQGRKEKIKKLLEIVELDQIEDILNKKIDQLSGGQQQRVAVARALSSNPKVIILDESFTSLDQWLRGAVRKQILNSIKKTNTTVIVITHDVNEAFELGDRVGVIDAGKLVQIGSSPKIYEEPVSIGVAKLVGATNILHYSPDRFGTNFKDFSINSNEDGDIVLMLRPEQVLLANSSSQNKVVAIVSEVRINGPLTDVYLTLKDSGESLISNNIEVARCAVGNEIEVCLSENGVLYRVQQTNNECT